jgi:hypothetical protein
MWFQSWHFEHFYLGEMISSDVPWHYIPVWMGVTVPILYIALFLAGIFAMLRKAAKKKSLHMYDLFFGAMFIFTLAGFIGFGINMYEGWRHAYGIFPAFLYVSVYGLQRANNYFSDKRKIAFACCVAISLIHSTAWISINHPYQYVYFNVVGRQFAENNFALDYWYVSINDLHRKISEIDARPHITVTDFNGHRTHMLTHEERARLEFVNSQWNAPDYLIRGSRFHINERRQPITGYEKIYSITVNGMEISSLHKYVIAREHFDNDAHLFISNIFSSSVYWDASNIADGNEHTSWRTDDVRLDGDFILVEFSQFVTYNLVRLNAVHRNEYANTSVAVSMDGENWYYPFIFLHNAVDNVFAPVEYKFIRIANTHTHEKYPWTIREIQFGNFDTNALF